MATEKTIFTNVFRDDTKETNNNQKNPIEYGMDFDGSEYLAWQPESFEAFGKTTRINSADLSRKIYAHFKQTLHELKGVNVIVLANNQIGVEMFFERNLEELPAGKIMSLDSLVNTSSKSNLYERVQARDNGLRGKTFTLNNETRLLLSKFMFGGTNAALPNNKVWSDKNVLREVHMPVNNPYLRGYNTDRFLVRVSGFDIRRILHELYGKDIVIKTVANEDGNDVNYRSDARYEVRFVKANPDGTFIMNIEQFNPSAVEEFFIKENPIPQQYLGVQMYN